ncbi:hypothetical protein CSUI_005705 [Cystoisospora suis]|uniref:Uncharacterized protein n=1 Tax=Cystoisospora suis TaxID=483139 RepID=A0A2C6KX07_9APIC|nr:hypothetical protein CSUI_005705 [Cystoisospora suis]
MTGQLERFQCKHVCLERRGRKELRLTPWRVKNLRVSVAY